MQQQTNNTSDIEKSITRYNYLTTSLTILASFIAIISMVLTIKEGLLLLLGAIPVVMLIVVIQIISTKRKKLKYLLQIRNNWGIRQVAKGRDFKAIRPLFDYLSTNDKSKDYIDE